MEKKKHKILKPVIAVCFAVIMLFSALPISAISGNYYQSEDSFNINYDTTNDVIRPVLDCNLLLVPNNASFDYDNYGEVLINNSDLLGNNFKIEDGYWSWNTLVPWIDTISCTTKDSPDKKSFSYSRGRLNTEVTLIPFVYHLDASSENTNKNDLAGLTISRKDKAYYRYTEPRGSDGTSYNLTYPQYMSVFAKDFYIKGEFLHEMVRDGGYFGYLLHGVDNDYYWLDGEYKFHIEYINMETGEEHTYSFTAPVGDLRSTNQNSLRMPLMTKKAVTDLTLSDTFGEANLIYVKNVYCNYNMKYYIVMEDSTDYGEYFEMYTCYLACNDVNIDGTDFNNTIDEAWNVQFDKELMPEILASRQRYLTSFVHKENLSYTNFIGNALKGVLEPDIFGTFGIGDVMGIIIAFAVVMAFLKYFAGG